MNSDNKITIKYNNTMYIFIIWLSHFRTVYQLSTLRWRWTQFLLVCRSYVWTDSPVQILLSLKCKARGDTLFWEFRGIKRSCSSLPYWHRFLLPVNTFLQIQYPRVICRNPDVMKPYDSFDCKELTGQKTFQVSPLPRITLKKDSFISTYRFVA